MHAGKQKMQSLAIDQCETEKSDATDAAFPPRITQTVEMSPIG